MKIHLFSPTCVCTTQLPSATTASAVAAGMLLCTIISARAAAAGRLSFFSYNSPYAAEPASQPGERRKLHSSLSRSLSLCQHSLPCRPLRFANRRRRCFVIPHSNNTNTHQHFGEPLVQLLAIRHRLVLSPDTGLSYVMMVQQLVVAVVAPCAESRANERCIRIPAGGRRGDDGLRLMERLLDHHHPAVGIHGTARRSRLLGHPDSHGGGGIGSLHSNNILTLILCAGIPGVEYPCYAPTLRGVWRSCLTIERSPRVSPSNLHLVIRPDVDGVGRRQQQQQ